MAINGVNGARFNPYTAPLGVARGGTAENRPDAAAEQGVAGTTTSPQDVASAIRTDAAARTAQVASAQAPDGVDQELWSVLTKEERGYFVKAGAMGPLTYGRNSAAQAAPSAPLVRGGRLDIRA